MPIHSFGGNWTEKKLERLKSYLKAYTGLFENNERAQYLTTHYVDAFAGTGSRIEPSGSSVSTMSLFKEQEDVSNVQHYYAGSARIALEIEPPFDHFLFVEKNAEFVIELQGLRNEYPDLAPRVEVQTGDSNQVLRNWCQRIDWSKNRAIVFLDPYGMAVEWDTVKLLGKAGVGKNGAVDLWVLLPIGQAVNRLLTRDRIPDEPWATRLTSFFGTNEWQTAFYRTKPKTQLTLFEDEEPVGFEKQANFENIADFFIDRLRTAFPYVAEHSLALLNTKNNPLFLLCFATSNRTAVNIANDVLRGKRGN